MVPRRFGDNLAVGVPRISGLPEPDSALIGSDASRHEISGDFGRVPEKHQQNALSHRVQGACVSYLFLPQPFESVGTLGGREPAWLVDHKTTGKKMYRVLTSYGTTARSSSGSCERCGSSKASWEAAPFGGQVPSSAYPAPAAFDWRISGAVCRPGPPAMRPHPERGAGKR